MNSIKSWLQILRVSNFPTVPGDPLAGFALAALGFDEVAWLRALPAIGSSLLIYAAGMIWNDCADYAEDLKHRPTRPLPSGQIKKDTAFVVGTILALAGVAVAALAGVWAFIVSLVLLLLVIAYDWSKNPELNRGRLAILNMGACRGVSLLLGAAVLSPPTKWSAVVVGAAVGVMLYISAVSWIAADELKSTFLSRYVGTMIRSLILIQATLCFFGGEGGVWAGGIILLGWPLSWWLGKKFYAS